MAANSLEKHCKIMAENANTCMRGHTIDYRKMCPALLKNQNISICVRLLLPCCSLRFKKHQSTPSRRH